MLAGDPLVFATSVARFLILLSAFILFSVLELFFNEDSPGSSASCRIALHLPTDEDVSTPTLTSFELW